LSLTEIKKLIHAGSDRERMLMLMALFAGMGQTELRWARHDEFDLDAGRFTHRRNKTRQKGSWYLPPELVTLLRAYFKKVKPLADGSAFSTREGHPLVTEASDSVRQWFEDVRKAAEIDRAGVTFYALLAIFPANVEMAVHAERFRSIPKPLLWLRLPLQGALIAWVWKTSAR